MRAVLASIRCQIFKVGRFNDKPVTETDRKGDCQTAATGQPNRSGENQLKPVAEKKKIKNKRSSNSWGGEKPVGTGQPNRSGENQLKPVADGWRKPIQLEAVLKVKQQQKKKKKA